MYKIIITFFLSFITFLLVAQTRVTHTNLLWFNYNNNIGLNKKWSIVNDVQVRTKDWASRWSQFALRTGAVYKITEKFSLSGGFAWFGNVKYFNDGPVTANEWRPWEEIAFQVNAGKNIFLQRLRLEQRFLQKIIDGKKTREFEKRQRLRYRFEFGFPLSNKKIEIHFGNEIMVNLNYISDNRFFDQNRIFCFVNFRLNPSLLIQYQYIKLLQWQAAGKVLDDQNVFRFSIHQQINAGK